MAGRDARRLLLNVKVKHLAALMGTEPPKRYPPDAAITTLQLRDLFSFITVSAYVRYVLFLSSAQQGAKTPAGGAPGSA